MARQDTTEAREERAARLLRELGVAGSCEAAGHQGEIAALRMPAAQIERLLEPEERTALSLRLRELGFAYVALDLDADGTDAGEMDDASGGVT